MLTTLKQGKTDRFALQVQLIRDLFACRFSPDFLRVASKTQNRYLVYKNDRLWNICATKMGMKPLCHNSQFVDTLCGEFPLQMAKTVRSGWSYLNYVLNHKIQQYNLPQSGSVFLQPASCS